MTTEGRPLTLFMLAVAQWLAGLTAAMLLFQVLSTPPLSGTWPGTAYLWGLPGTVGVLLPFTAFAGGLTLARVSLGTSRSILFGAILALLAYMLLAYARPIANHRAAISRDEHGSSVDPLGPSTPGQLKTRRSAVRADPPDRYSFRVDRPLESPPNWLTYRIQSPFALAIFSILAALLGQQTGFLTSGLSPPARRNARWALGLVSGLAFFAAEAVGGEWVRLALDNSGVAGAWLPMLVPLLEFALLAFVVRRHALHGGASSGV